jgi:hypothetical protein
VLAVSNPHCSSTAWIDAELKNDQDEATRPWLDDAAACPNIPDDSLGDPEPAVDSTGFGGESIPSARHLTCLMNGVPFAGGRCPIWSLSSLFASSKRSMPSSTAAACDLATLHVVMRPAFLALSPPSCALLDLGLIAGRHSVPFRAANVRSSTDLLTWSGSLRCSEFRPPTVEVPLRVT